MDYLTYLNENKDRFINDLKGLLEIESVLDERPDDKDAPFGVAMVQALNHVLNLAEKMGFKTKNVDNVAGHIEYGTKGEVIGILCHLDVVPAGGNWTYPPFRPTVIDGKIYARGSEDDKGAVIAALYAMKALKDGNVKLNHRIRLILGTDEETESRGIKHYFTKEEIPVFAFSPDAGFPLIYGEKGIMTLKLTSCKVSPLLKELKGGERANIVPDAACVKLNENYDDLFMKYLQINKCKGEITSEGYKISGRRAHAMEPDSGINAVLLLSGFLAGITDDDLISFTHEKLSSSRLKDLHLAWHDDVMGDLTCNVAVMNITEKGGEVLLNLRYPLTWNKEKFFKQLQEELAKYNLNYTVLSDNPPHYVEKDGKYARKLYQAYVYCTKDKSNLPYTIGGGTYARVLKNAVAFGPVFPMRKSLAHQTDEHAYIDDLLLASFIYAYSLELLG